jgi:amino acid adenylation domain-containing protein/non-ribosomal peptide synthase protein (TIGR01720 family)
MTFNKIIDILHAARKSGIDITVKEGRLQLATPKGKPIDPELLQALKSNKTQIVDYLSDERWQLKTAGTAIPVFNRQELPRIPLSYEQESLWFIDRLQGSTQFHIPRVFRLTGQLDIEALENAVRTVLQRHEILRTVICEEEGIGYQEVREAANWQLQVVERAGLPASETDLRKYIEEQILQPFDLSTDLMLRVTLLQLSEQEYILVAVMHHIAADGWSISVVVRELVELYRSYMQHRPAILEPLPIQYADYAVWQRNYLSGETLNAKLDYWKKQLTGVEPLTLPTDFTRPSGQSIRGGVVTKFIDKETSDAVMALAQQEGATLFMTLLTLFKILLHRYTGQDDICVGSPIAGRQQQEVEGLVGFFLNALALRSDLANDPSFKQLLQQVRQTTLNAYEHQDVPFEKIVKVLDITRDASLNPVFQVRFAIQNAPTAGKLDLYGVQLEQEAVDQITVQIDLNLIVIESPEGLYISLYYCSDLYKEATVASMLDHYENLLHAVLENKETPIGQLSMLSAAEEDQLLHQFNNTAAEYPAHKTIIALLEEQAAKTPAAIAVMYQQQSLTYAMISERSDLLANYLRSKGVGVETLVPVCLQRTPDMIIAIMAIWKAGGAYIPLDPGYPIERVRYIVQDLGASVVITDFPDLFKDLPVAVERISHQEDWEKMAGAPKVQQTVEVQPSHLAYIIYTSGSTGQPKGAMIEQAGMLNHLYAKINECGINANSRIAQTAAFTFDISVWQLFAALVCGGSTIIYPEAIIHQPGNFLLQLETDGITIAELVPSYLFSVLEENSTASLHQLQQLMVTGEAVSPAVLQTWFRRYPGKPVINAYGPTEASDDICHYHMTEAPAMRTVPVGKPIQNMQLYITDKKGRLCPAGGIGEICVAGIGVGRGYWKDETKTHRAFGIDPFNKKSNHRMYRTGDLGRWLPDGNIEYLGRKDEQVKIRGYRIELGEVESVLQKAPGIKQCVVVAKSGKQDTRRLIGYLVPENNFDKEVVNVFLKNNLPEYMVPGVLVALENMPLTANGKIDRKRLPEVADLLSPLANYQAPRNETEAQVVSIWQELLDVQQISIHDNFFELGGHSLLTMRMVSKIRQQFNKEITIKAIFDHPTIATLSVQITKQTIGGATPAIQPHQLATAIPLSFAQERLWFVDRLQGTLQYHMPWVFRLTGLLDIAALEWSLQEIVNRHEVLRTVIREKEGIGYQDIRPRNTWAMKYMEVEDITDTGITLQTFIERFILRPYNLSKDPMLRVTLIRLSKQEHILVALMHHIAFDAWSIAIMVQELAALYRSRKENKTAALKELPVQYADYAVWQRSWLQGNVLETKLAYWKEKLQDVKPATLVTDFPRGTTPGIRGATVARLIDKSLYDALVALSRQEGVTLFMTLLATFKILLYRYTGQEDICVGSPIAGRQQEETESLIGFFINALALRTDLGGDPDFKEVLFRVKQTTVGAFEHQDIPFEKIVEVLDLSRDLSRNPIFEIKFALQNAPVAGALDLSGVELTMEDYGQVAAQIDISLDIAESPEGLHLGLTYCSELYSGPRMEIMLGHYANLLQQVVQAAAAPISQLTMLSAGEEQQLLETFNATETNFAGSNTVVERFEEWVARTPHELAIVFREEQLTYQQLEQRANQLAHYLLGMGLHKEMLVAICMDRSVEMIVSILGILKAGGAYLPIDPEYPSSRIEYMLEDSQCGLLITTTDYQDTFNSLEHPPTLITIDQIGELLFQAPAHPNQQDIHPNNLAYVIYTSGSTGHPKGVMVEHGGVVNLVNSQVQPLQLHPGIRVFQFASCSFDASCYEIFNTLLEGGRLILAGKETILDPALLRALLLEQEVELITLPPSYQSVIGEEGLSIKTVVSAGEALNTRLAAAIEAQGIRLVNAYGPTENTVCAILSVSPLHSSGCVTIGKPIANVQAYILDQYLHPVAIGVIGELYLGGAQLARGYLNRPELTKEKFIQHPFSQQPGAQVYRTGDMARWLPDGNIEFVGRVDEQVKIRGYRVELGEIERVLEEAPGVRQGVIVAKEDSEGVRRLIGYIVPGSNYNKEAVAQYLKEKLPEYMVPGSLVVLETIPLNTSGKVDRKRLLELEAEQPQQAYAAPRNETEHTLVMIWQDLLEIEQPGIYDNFFELGGHSLLAIQLIASMRKALNKEVTIKEVFDYATIAALAQHLDTQQDADLLPALARSNRDVVIPLSFAQERLWFIDRLQGSVQYHMPWVFKLTGNLDIPALESAFRAIVNRHEILRTVIREEQGIGYQQIQEPGACMLQYYRQQDLSETGNTLSDFTEKFIRQPFNLSIDPMLRVGLIEVADQEFILIAVMHHIAADGWSISIVVQELVELYRSRMENRTPVLKELPLQYADYAIWQRSYLPAALLESKLDWWKTRLSGVEPLALLTDYPRPATQSIRGAMVHKHLGPELRNALLNLSIREGATLFMTLLSVFKILLYRYTGQADSCVGSPTAGRRQQEVEGLIGFFVNTLAFRTKVNGQGSLTELLQQVKQTTLDAYENEDIPFEKIVEVLDLTRDLSRNPVFQVKFALQNAPEAGILDLHGVQLTMGEQQQVNAQIDISLDIAESARGLFLSITYCSDLYSKETMERMLAHYENLLEAIVADSSLPIDLLPVSTSSEQQQLLVDFNDNTIDLPSGQTILSLFNEWVNKTPGATALVFEEEHLSYDTVDKRSNQLAHYLRSLGVQQETLVAICLERSPELIISMLGILKAGGAYLPIDPEYPADRILYLLEDSGCKLVITNTQDSVHAAFNTEDISLLYLDEAVSSLRAQPVDKPTATVQENNLAYVIYTSGSTGLPKGVMIEHRSVVNLVYNQVAPLGLHQGIPVFQFASCSFDASCHEIFTTLLHGGQLILAPKATLLDPVALCDVLAQHSVELITLPPSYQSAIKEARLPLRTLISAGEMLNRKLAEEIQQQGIKLINAYGPTENTVSAILSESPLHESGCVTIGKPLANVQAFILDQQLQPVPVGVLGELYLGGEQLARGYLNRPELTAEKFITNPFSSKPGARLYRTGDMARWLSDGNIEFLGRKDDQVKVRGYRIELGEIETVLQQAPGVQQSAVLAKEDKQGTKYLIGYLVTGSTYHKEEMIGYLKEKLPEYMIPGIWVTMESMPLNTSGKIDRKQLPEPDATFTVGSRVARNATEQQLVTIWQELLELQQVGIDDDFFELGGHSLLAIQLIAAIRNELGKEVAIKEVFDHPTIAMLAGQMNSQENTDLLPLVQRRTTTQHIPLSFAQERLWFIDRLQGSVQYHMPSVFRLRGTLDIPAMETALRTIVNRHEVLRTVIHEEDGIGYQLINPPGGWQLQYVQKKELADDETSLQILLEEYIQRPFDLSADYLMRAALIRLSSEEHLLVAVLHHIAFDGWSAPIILQELTALYNGQKENRPVFLPELPIQYADYAIWQRQYLSGELLHRKLSYWKEQLSGVAPLTLPTDYRRPAEPGIRGGLVQRSTSKTLRDELAALSQQEGVTMFMTLLSAFNILLYRYAEQTDICVGTPVAGRHQLETEGLIGCFVNTLALRNNLGGNPAFKDLLKKIRQTTLDAYEHQDVPFEKVVEAVGVERDMSRTPVFQVMFAMLNPQDAASPKMNGLQLSGEPSGKTTAHFDISFDVVDTGMGLQFLANYCSDLYTGETIQRMLLHYETLLQSIVTNLHSRISNLPILPAAEEDQILHGFNTSDFANATDNTIMDIFSAQAAATPDAVAVSFEGTSLSYHELDIRSNQLGHYLRSRGVQEEMLVPICVPRSLEMTIGILGILKAGGAWVPIDPDYPEERIGFMLKDTGCHLLLTTTNFQKLSSPLSQKITPICLDEPNEKISLQSTGKVNTASSPHHLAYMIYTSGSTGQPKGVLVEHRSLINLIHSRNTGMGIQPDEKIIQFYNYCFDASVEQIFLALMNGAQLVLISEETRMDKQLFEEALISQKITHLDVTPGFLHTLEPGKYASLRRVVAGGELCTAQLAARWAGELDFYNAYGPTEATVTVTTYLASDTTHNQEEGLPIGKPIANARIYIVDSSQKIAPIGIAGELCIGGVAVARGYLNRPELDREKFVADPFSTIPGARMYRTGDKARWLPDGNIAFLGRIDEQVKIRGYRIELGEIESVLQRAPGVKQCVVITDGDKNALRLVGYLITTKGYDKEATINYLKSVLPEYMVPGVLLEVDKIPLTSNGKIDRSQLPEIAASLQLAATYQAPRNEVEEKLTLIWQELLGIAQVGINDNFFELGGDSIITIQVVSRMKRLGYSLSPRDLFQHQTIAGISTVLAKRAKPVTAASSKEIALTGHCGLLPIQQIFFNNPPPVVSYYNQAVLLTIHKDIEAPVLQQAITTLLNHHDSLRFSYHLGQNGWEQVYGNNAGTLVVEDLRNATPGALQAAIEDHGNKYQRSLDIEKGDLLRVVLMHTPPEEAANRLLVVIHHLAVDGVSWRILLEDLELLLTALQKKQLPSLGKKSSSYREWFECLVKYAMRDRILNQKDYWEKIVQSNSALPIDKGPDTPCTMKDLQTHTARLSTARTVELLQEVAPAYHTEINDLLLAALTKTICQWSRRPSLTIALEGHGREELGEEMDLSRTVGWFTNLYPVLLELPVIDEPGHLIKSVKEQLRQVPDKGMGYGLLKYLQQLEDLKGGEPWDLVFNYLGQADNVVNKSQWLAGAPESAGRSINEAMLRTNKLELNAIVSGGELIVSWSYSGIHYEKNTIIALAQQYIDNLESIIAHCLAQNISGQVFTPSDYGLTNIVNYTALDRFLEEPVNGKPRKQTMEALYRLSSLQEGILFHRLYESDAAVYLEQMSGEVTGLQLDAFQRSWDLLLKKHSILRTAFYPDRFKIPVQVVYKDLPMPITLIDYRGLPNEEQQWRVEQFAAADIRKGFDLTQAPLMRVSLLQLQDDRYKMIWTTHHLVLDGWSVPVLIEEFLTNYDLLIAGQVPDEAATDRYEEYIRYTDQRDQEQEAAYWKEYLRPIETPCLLPFVNSMTGRKRNTGSYREDDLVLDAAITNRIGQYAQQLHLTINTILQGVWAYLLHCYTGSPAIVYGITVSGRPEDLPGMESRVGMYINSLPLHTVIPSAQSIPEWLRLIQEAQLLSREYQYTSLSAIQQWTGLSGDLFNSMMSFQNYPVAQLLTERRWQLQVDDLQIHEQTLNYPFNIRVIAGHEIIIQLIYKEEWLDEFYVKMIKGHFEQVLLQVINPATVNLSDLQLLTAPEQQQLLKEFNNTNVDFTGNHTIISRFGEWAARTPDALSIVFKDEQLTYRQLDQRGNQLAHYLRNLELQKETVVGICLDRSVEMIVSILGIIKAGGAYLPIDPEYPADRIAYLLNDSQCNLLITTTGYQTLFDPIDNPPRIVAIDQIGESLAILPTHQPDAEIDANNLAYVIYTSGSTGHPKGVMIEHGGVVNLVNSQVQPLQLHPGIRVFQFASCSFDASCYEIFNTLLEGGRLVLAGKETILDPDLLRALLIEQEVELITLPPSYQSVIGEEGLSIKTVVSAGEALNTRLAAAIEAQGIRLINAYGPTENTVCAILSDSPLHPTGCVTIGKPIANVQAYILDQYLHPVAIGVTGELYLGGAQLARGYLNRPELTAEKFIADPFSRQTGARLYRTGDMARWLPDGNIEFLGRKDDQVKIRGYRVELGEIESVLQQAPGVQQGAVLAKEDKQGNKHLVGYLVTLGAYNKEEITDYLKEKLPDYMIPGSWILLNSMPLNTSGKIDRKQLPDSDGSLAVKGYNEPRNETEQQLASIWQELLGLEQVGIDDDFFELGGHSLLAIQLIAAIRKELGKEVAIKEVFDHPTIALLSQQILGQENIALLPAVQRYPRTATMPLSFAQERIWFIDRLQGSVQYHMPSVFRLTGSLNKTALENSLRTIIARHEVLRTVIREEDGIGYQQIIESGQWQLEYKLINEVAGQGLTVEGFIEHYLQQPFDLSADFMLRAVLIRLSPEEHLLVAVLHHIAFDGWSISIIVQELATLYRSNCENFPASLQDLPIQYADYASWQREYLQGDLLHKKLDYWKQQLDGVEPLALPTDFMRPAEQAVMGGLAHLKINKQLRDELVNLSHQEGTTLFMTLLGAFNILLFRYTDQADLCIGSPVAGRQQQEIEGLIGCFMNTLPLRSKLDGQMNSQELLRQVKQTTLNAYEHQDLPFEKIVEALGVERDMSRTPVFQVMFALQNLPESGPLNLGNVALSGEDGGAVTAKFDLNCTVSESPDGLQIVLTYCSDLYRQETIERMLGHYENLLRAMLHQFTTPIALLPLTNVAEERQLLEDFGRSKVYYPSHKTMVHLFEEQVAKNPEGLALVFNQQQLTYSQLNERAALLASFLKAQGLQPEELVVIAVNRSVETIVGMLGILKAGGAYVPVRSDYPDERLQFILEDTACRICLTDEALQQRAANFNPAIRFINIDASWQQIASAPGQSVANTIQVHTPVYVIYTSGSTGKPKGVLIEHQSLVDHVYGVIESAGLQQCRSFALFASLVADAGHSILFASFVTGSTIHILPDELLQDGEQIVNYLEANAIDGIKIVPSLWLSYSDGNHIPLPRKLLLFGGEAFSLNILERLRTLQYQGDVFNHYGPTETTIGKCIHKVDLQQAYQNVPIGVPFSNTRAYILNKWQQLCPVGVPGELYIGGDGLARGYLNLPALTTDKFIADPYKAGQRMYKTGDLVKWLPNGHIEYLGRMDEQVKIRGYRIEPGEIETVLNLAAGISQSVVVLRTDKAGIKRLIAYIVTTAGYQLETTLAWLRDKLPDYMVPAMLVEIERIPLTAIGKIDKKRLPEPEGITMQPGSYVAPRNELEIALATVWGELLGNGRIGILDNFFELGGDSIITIQVVSRMKRLGYELHPRDLFQHQTIGKLSAAIVNRAATAGVFGEQGLLTGASGLLPIQQIYFGNAPQAVSHFNQSSLMGIDKSIEVPVLEEAVKYLLSQHDALRFTYLRTDNGWQQTYGTYTGELTVEDLRSTTTASLPATIEALGNQYQRSLHLEAGILIRVVLMLTPEEIPHNRLLIVVHHLAVDGVSWRILLDDLEQVITALQQNKKITPARKGSSYREWYQELVKYGESKRLLVQKKYWEKTVQGFQPLPVDHADDTPVSMKLLQHFTVKLPTEQTRQLLQDAPQAYHTGINDILLGALVKTICEWCHQPTLVIGFEGHGREDLSEAIDTSRTVGWFTNLYPVLLEMQPGMTTGDLIKNTKEQLRKVPDKGLGYGVLKYITQQEGLLGKQPWDLLFNYFGQSDNVVNKAAWFTGAGEPMGDTMSEDMIRGNKLELNSIVSGGELIVQWGYSSLHYERATMDALANNYLQNLEAMISHCLEQNKTGSVHTPSDYGLTAEVSYEELDQFLKEEGTEMDSIMNF